MNRLERKVLVLDAKYEPIKVVSLEVGFSLIYSGRATSIVDSERIIKGVQKDWKVPWILRLEGSRPKHKKLNGPKFSRQNVYLRDNFTCQYCNYNGPTYNLTLDHLIPSAKGGKTTWDNIITACKTCNMKKGSKTVEELGIVIMRPPQRPAIHPKLLFPLRFGITKYTAPPEWLPYLDMSLADRGLREFEASPVLISQNLQATTEFSDTSPKL